MLSKPIPYFPAIVLVIVLLIAPVVSRHTMLSPKFELQNPFLFGSHAIVLYAAPVCVYEANLVPSASFYTMQYLLIRPTDTVFPIRPVLMSDP